MLQRQDFVAINIPCKFDEDILENFVCICYSPTYGSICLQDQFFSLE